ncbi:hypothetical protein FHR24_002158 [Wenyingzhuangia heitensis]|uniref:Outer membrane lipoprotein-sorting protein n=1 Tax=Wenyingzhuangia heitensis TaxID=1487859 RepID=A0ABX0UA49_9FLAO|nr:hypothetical protein [Wenyingzhuangia heitensis]NIJ45690.1 hypothetical protein [Wenyingzhuangia heitensis]
MKTLITFLFSFLFIFNISAQSDQKAIKIANKVMETMGGEENWNNVHYLKWNFGKRILHWNKWSGNVRVESPKETLVILVNINTNKGKAFKNGKLITDTKESEKLVNKAKKWWINDSYWLTMPWKLLDPGVTLKYIDTTKLKNGHKADILQMTFEKVGVTPNNKYYVYVDTKENLIKQWAFFANYKDEKPKFTKPWDNYQKLENVLLSFDRSDFGPKNVEAKQTFDSAIFTDL